MSSIATITAEVAALAIGPINPSLSSEPRKNFRPWLHAVNRFARSLFAQFDVYGLLFLVATDAIWNILPHNLVLGQDGQPIPNQFRARPDFHLTPVLQDGATPAARETYKTAQHAHRAFLSDKATLLQAMIASIGT